MMSASAISAQIRAKKKKMEAEHSDAVKLSGIPEDATDIETMKQHEATDSLNENHPMEHDDSPELPHERAQETAAEPHDEESPDPKQINQPEDGERESRKANIRKMLVRMGK